MGGSSQVTQLHLQSGWQFEREGLHGQPGVILAPPPVFNAECVSMLELSALESFCHVYIVWICSTTAEVR